MLTAKVDDPTRIESWKAGADAVLSKPFNKAELLIRINKLIGIREKLRVALQ